MRARGDAALVELTNKFDRANVTADDAETFRRRDRRRAGPGARQAQLAAIETAAARIEAYHSRQLPEDDSFTDDTGARAGLALDARGQRGPLCAGRHRRLSRPRC